MQIGGSWARTLQAACALTLTAGLAGCGFDNVELNGAVFEYLGVATGQQERRGEPQVAARPGLVLPPDAEKLPAPGAPGADGQPPASEVAWPVDADQQKVAAAAALDRQHEAFCREALWKAKIQGREDEVIHGPKGSCNPSILKALAGKDVTTQR